MWESMASQIPLPVFHRALTTFDVLATFTLSQVTSALFFTLTDSLLLALPLTLPHTLAVGSNASAQIDQPAPQVGRGTGRRLALAHETPRLLPCGQRPAFENVLGQSRIFERFPEHSRIFCPFGLLTVRSLHCYISRSWRTSTSRALSPNAPNIRQCSRAF